MRIQQKQLPARHCRQPTAIVRRGLLTFPSRRPTVIAAGKNGSRLSVPSVKLVGGVPVDGPNLAVSIDGMTLPNPFVIASGPPGTNYAVMKRAFDEGWGGVICKSLTLDASEIHNVTPRYAQLHAGNGAEVVGWENIELTSDRPLETMLEDLRRLRDEYPDRILFASIMEKNSREAWEELIERVEATGVNGIEINFSCPHGLPEMGMGMVMGQCPEMLQEVSSWIYEKATVPIWAKMTPNITDIREPARAALDGGCNGISAINTISSIMGVDLETLKPQPSVGGYTTPGGYSFKAVKPIALAHVQKCAKMIQSEYQGKKSLSAIGGIESGSDAAEFLLMGADTVQVCTGIMVHGYGVIQKLCGGLQAFMQKHGFETIEDFRGTALPYVTTHGRLVQIQKDLRKERKAAEKRLVTDADWTGDGFSKEAQSMVSN